MTGARREKGKLVGSRIARYELVRRCDDSVLGEELVSVFRADSGLLSACRLLVVSPEPDLDREEALARLRPLMALDHPGIVRMIDAGWAGDRLFVAYDLRPSRSLAAVVERHLEFRGPLHPALAVEICASIARSLQHAHRELNEPLPCQSGSCYGVSMLGTRAVGSQTGERA